VAAFVAKAFAYLVVGLRFPIILAWAAAAVVAVLLLPPLPSSRRAGGRERDAAVRLPA
jgi:uncharacterized membrane protein YdfJ with MMPL/SSD domain